MTIYKIKPLAWEGGNESMRAWTPFGTYYISKHDERDEWRWSYCFDEYYDEGHQDADTIEEAKLAAEQHWQDRLAPALEVTKGGGASETTVVKERLLSNKELAGKLAGMATGNEGDALLAEAAARLLRQKEIGR